MIEPIDSPVDSGVDRGQYPGSLSTQENRDGGGVTGTVQVPHPHSSLPWPTPVLLATVTRFSLLSSSQLRRLHYQGTDRGTKARSSRHLKRLSVGLGKLRRIPGVFAYGPREYFYTLPDSTAKPDDHDLFGVELYVRLAEALNRDVDYETEPRPRIGQVELNPDAYLELSPEHKFFIEMDLASERPARLREKMKPYSHAYHDYWDEHKHGGKFPLVVWVVFTEHRMLTLQKEIKKQDAAHIFTVLLFDNAVRRLTKGIR